MFVSKEFRFIRLFKFNTETQVDERRTKHVSNDTGDLPVFKKGHAHEHMAFTCARLALVYVYEFKGTVVHVYGYEGTPCTYSGTTDNVVIILLPLLRVANSLKIHVRTLFRSFVGLNISKRNSHFFDKQCVLSPEYACGYKFPIAKA